MLSLRLPLYGQVLIAIGLGALLGSLDPELGAQLKPLGDGFIRLVKMLVAPVVFTTVVAGIARMGDLHAVGRVGVKALVYFEVLTTAALVIGLVVVNLAQPGAGMDVDPGRLDKNEIAAFTASAHAQSTVTFLLRIIPDSLAAALVGDNILQVLFVAILFGLALARAGSAGQPVLTLVESVGTVLFGIVGIIMYVAPIGAFGAMAFTVARFGLGTLLNLGKLMACVYVTCLFFVLVVLGSVVRAAGLRLWPLLRYLAEEILVVLGTSSSEAALPRLMVKLERLGCTRAVVGLVVPTGYSFNLDGTCIYLTMAAVFIAQATNTPLSLGQQLALLGVLLLTSKGAAAVSGGGFITLAATLPVVGDVPVEGLALLLGVDRFMSEARAITNLIGNAVATVVVARWEGSLDLEQANRVLRGEKDVTTQAETDEPAG